jgi:hypothetical protein
MAQSPSSVVMVSPDHFRFNHETAPTNAFQNQDLLCEGQHIHEKAMDEFRKLVELLRENGVEVHEFSSPKGKSTPDAVFSNNWISFHEDGRIFLYPMLTPNRREERRLEIIDEIKKHFFVSEIVDLTHEENDNRILEGTGSIVFDRHNMVAYANASARTNKNLFYDVVELLGYEGIFFRASDKLGKSIYHTNVLLTIGDGFAVVCKEVIDSAQAAEVINSLEASGLDVIEINYQQMEQFAGNMISLQNKKNEKLVLMSTAAYNSLNESQKSRISTHSRIIHSDINTIEKVGGGSVRCMIAGIHLPRK